LLISLIDEIDMEVANLSKKRGEKAKKDLEKQLERKARAEKDLEDVRRELAGLRGEGVDGTETGVGEAVGTGEEGVAQEGVEGDVKVEPDTEVEDVKVEADKADALKDVEGTAKALEGVDALRNKRTSKKKYGEVGGVEVVAEFGRNGKITYTISRNGGIQVDSIDRDKTSGDLQTDNKNSVGEGSAAIASIFNSNPNVDEIYYDDESGGFWDSIGGDTDMLTREAFFNYYNNKSQKLSEAYHKAKADGSNPELVAAVENLLGKAPKAEIVKKEPEFGSVGVGGDVDFTAKGGNKAVDKKGEPITLYRAGEIDTPIKNDKYTVGRFFTTVERAAEAFGKDVKKAIVVMKNPFIVDAKEAGYSSIEVPKQMREYVYEGMDTVDTDNIAEWAYENGYDGVIIKNVYEGGSVAMKRNAFGYGVTPPLADNYIVFDAKQIKAVEQSLKETKAGSVVGGDNKSEFTDVGYVAARKKADGILENKKEATPIVGIRNAGSGSGVFVPFRMVKDEWIDSETTKREEGETFIYDDVNDKYYNVKDFSKSELDFLTDRDNFSEQSLKETNVTQQEGKDKADVGGTKGKGSQKVPQNGTDSKKSPSEKVEQPPQVRPQKQVKANQKIATEEVAEARGEDVGDMNVLYSNQFRNLPVIDDTDTDAMLTYEAEGMPNGLEKDSVPPQIRKRVNGLLDKGYLYYDGGMFYLTPKGAEIVDAIDARLETRQRVKGGTDLFPNEAKIGENTLGSAIASAKALDQAFKAGIDLSQSVEDNIQEMEDKGIIEKDCN
jgi:hypothetical protein